MQLTNRFNLLNIFISYMELEKILIKNEITEVINYRFKILSQLGLKWPFLVKQAD